jgi:hypothetical protein
MFVAGFALKVIGGAGMLASGALLITKILIDTGYIVP